MVKKGHFGSNIYLFLWYTNDINPYPWILGENQKHGTVAERVCRKKNRAQRCIICIVCFCALDFPEIALGGGLKNGICFRSARCFRILSEIALGDGPKNSRIRVKNF